MPGRIVILNGAPRSGKSSIAAAIRQSFEGPWMGLGVDAWAAVTPERLHPGIGLRPGGERPDLEPMLPVLFAALYDSIAASSRLGLNVVADLGHHDSYSRPLHMLPDCARRVSGLPVLFVGVRCDIATIMARRRAEQTGREGFYETGTETEAVPAAVLRWQQAVHDPGLYDLEVDTTAQSPEDCAEIIRRHLADGATAPTVFERLAAKS